LQKALERFGKKSKKIGKVWVGFLGWEGFLIYYLTRKRFG